MYDNIIALGVLVSLIFAEITGFSPAGLIVPGYLALNLKTPFRAVYTVAIALAAYFAVKLLGRFFIIYGRRLFAVTIIAAFLINLALTGINSLLPQPFPLPGMIGVLVPGIMASEFRKQGIFRSLCGAAVVTCLIVLIAQIFGQPLL